MKHKPKRVYAFVTAITCLTAMSDLSLYTATVTGLERLHIKAAYNQLQPGETVKLQLEIDPALASVWNSGDAQSFDSAYFEALKSQK